MSKKGFTLIELLVTILLIALISGIGIITYKRFFDNAKDNYYHTIENSMILAGNNYFEDHHEIGNQVSKVLLETLVKDKYIETVKDMNGNICNKGIVIQYKEDNKLKYEACLYNCGGFNSTGKYCHEYE